MNDQTRSLADAARRLLSRLILLDTTGDTALETARQSEIDVVDFILDLLSLGSNLTKRGRAHVARQLACHEQWLDDLEASDEGRLP